MLVFRKGVWTTVTMPAYVDPSWTFGDRQKAATVVCEAMEGGLTFEEAWVKAEIAVQESLGNNIAPQRTRKNMAV
jgi:hypothetical protein